MSDVNLCALIHIWSYVYHLKWLLVVYNSQHHALFSFIELYSMEKCY